MSVARLLTVADLRVVFEGDRGSLTEAVAGVSFSLCTGSTLGIVAAFPISPVASSAAASQVGARLRTPRGWRTGRGWRSFSPSCPSTSWAMDCAMPLTQRSDEAFRCVAASPLAMDVPRSHQGSHTEGLPATGEYPQLSAVRV